MVFNSITFVAFFLAFMALYAPMHGKVRIRNTLVAFASYVFYGWWDVRFLILVGLSTSLDYCAALGASGQEVKLSDRAKSAILLVTIAATAVLLAHRDHWLFNITAAVSGLFFLAHFIPLNLDEPSRRKAWLLLSLVANFGLLFTFKYFNFFVDQATALASAVGLGEHHIALRFVLPVGISFFTFQATGRTIDSYLGRFRPSSNITNYAAFHAFFPQLVAGPIERAAHLMPQFETVRPISWTQIGSGSLIFLWGLYKKVVIADNLAPLVDITFGHQGQPATSGQTLVSVLAFTLQIYGDFSGYSDMARGIAMIMGFDLMRNFNLPYFSRTPSEFWRRWHISLSQWLRDFIYIPLGGSKSGQLATDRNLMITMLLGGLWHGAAWTFMFWGMFHGAIQVMFRRLNIDAILSRQTPWSFQSVALGLLCWVFTTCLVMLGWVAFRAGNFADMMIALQSIFGWQGPLPDLSPLLLVWPLLTYEAVEFFSGRQDAYLSLPRILKFHFGLVVALLILALRAKGSPQFIYFDF